MNAHPFQPTPEPWVIESCPANAPATLIIGNPTEGQSVAIVTGDPNQPHVQSNARLIIAAPRMLAMFSKLIGLIAIGAAPGDMSVRFKGPPAEFQKFYLDCIGLLSGIHNPPSAGGAR